LSYYSKDQLASTTFNLRSTERTPIKPKN